MLMNTTFLGDSFSIKWQSRDEDIEVVAQIIYDHVKHNRYDMTGVPLEIFPKEPQQ